VPGDTPHTSGRSLDELTKEELRAVRVRLHERAGRIVSLAYLIRPAVDSTGEAKLPEGLLIPSGRGFAIPVTISDAGGHFDEDERAEMEQLIGEMMQKYREQVRSQQSRQPER
jgi:hypothetical protein